MDNGGMDELLARAILDLELKMKHELRQNNACLLAKMEKHQEQMDKRLTHIELMVDSLSRDREGRHPQQQHNRGGRTSYHGYPPVSRGHGANAYQGRGGSSGMTTTDFPRNNRPPAGERATTAPNTPYGGGVPPSPLGGQQQHPYKVFGFGGAGGGGGPTGANRQFKSKYEKTPVNGSAGGHGHGGRYKQTLGTNKAQTTSPTQQSQWTAKVSGVIYTDDEDSDGDEDAVSSDGSGSKYSVAKPEDEGQQREDEEPNEEQKEPSEEGKAASTESEVKLEEKMAIFETLVDGKKVFVSKFESYIEGMEEQQQQEDPPYPAQDIIAASSSSTEMVATGTKSAAVAAAVAAMMSINKENHQSMSTVTPGATISPAMGGFGRSRRH